MAKTVALSQISVRSLSRDAILITGAVALIALAAQISVPLWPVPVTLSTLAVMIVAATLGSTRGTLSILGYLSAGALGLPVFAGAAALSAVRPTFGYLVGFVVAAAIIGFAISRGANNNVLRLLGLFTIATAVIYLFGASWLVIGFGMTAYGALMAGVVPFLLGDALKIAIATSVVMAVKKFRN